MVLHQVRYLLMWELAEPVVWLLQQLISASLRSSSTMPSLAPVRCPLYVPLRQGAQANASLLGLCVKALSPCGRQCGQQSSRWRVSNPHSSFRQPCPRSAFTASTYESSSDAVSCFSLNQQATSRRLHLRSFTDPSLKTDYGQGFGGFSHNTIAILDFNKLLHDIIVKEEVIEVGGGLPKSRPEPWAAVIDPGALGSAASAGFVAPFMPWQSSSNSVNLIVVTTCWTSPSSSFRASSTRTPASISA